MTMTRRRDSYRTELQGINRWLARADIRFDASLYHKPVDVYARHLYRRFTQGSFDSGGRLFGGFWQSLPDKSKRYPYSVRLKGLRIDGEAVADWIIRNSILSFAIASLKLNRRPAMPTRFPNLSRIGMA